VPRTRRWLLVCLIGIGVAEPGRQASAAPPEQEPSEHVRSTSTVIATLIQHATERSNTFRDLVQAISVSDGIVYVEEGACGLGRRSCFVNVTMAGPNRMLWVMLDVRGVDCDLMGLIGHELQHTVEVLGDPQVTGFAAMYNFYSLKAAPGHSFPFETDGAKRAGEAVRTEVRQKSRCTKVR
jgi:hypothetical protein